MTPQRIQLRRTCGSSTYLVSKCLRCDGPGGRGQLGYCSPVCRFLARVRVSEEDGGCWIWTGRPHNRKGYARFNANGRRYLAHRWAYSHFVAPLADDIEAHHACENTMCVNPAHIIPLTPEQHRSLSHPGRAQRLRVACPRGHPYQGSNLRVDGTGRRHCRACDIDRGRRRRAS